MDANFWHQKWQRGEIAFHQGEANRFLTDHFEKLNLANGQSRLPATCVARRVTLPGCWLAGIAWLAPN